MFFATGVAVVILLLIFSGVAAAVAAVAAWIALLRHFAQTEADRQRRITESFSKAIEQLGSDKLEVRLGGIYALERISQESPRDYWTVVENLTAFVRERTRRAEAERTARPLDQRISERAYLLWENAGRPVGRSKEFWAEAVEREPNYRGEPPAADILAVLTVINRRSEADRALEARDNRVLDFRQVVLRDTDLRWAQLADVLLDGAHLEGARLTGANLERANLTGAHLEGAVLISANLEHADLSNAHLEGADLALARLEGAGLYQAHLGYAVLTLANLDEAHLEGAHLGETQELTQAQIDAAFGDAKTELPPRLVRPARWTQPERGAEPAA